MSADTAVAWVGAVGSPVVALVALWLQARSHKAERAARTEERRADGLSRQVERDHAAQAHRREVADDVRWRRYADFLALAEDQTGRLDQFTHPGEPGRTKTTGDPASLIPAGQTDSLRDFAIAVRTARVGVEVVGSPEAADAATRLERAQDSWLNGLVAGAATGVLEAAAGKCRAARQEFLQRARDEAGFAELSKG